MTETLHQRVAEQAARTPAAVAVVMEGEALTYAALDAESNRLARCLLEVGCERGDRICLFLPKSLAAIVAMLGSLKAGCAYVPVDLDSPGPRLAKIVARAEPRVVIVASEAAARLEEVRAAGGVDESVRVGALSGDDFGDLAFDAAAIAARSPEPVAPRTGGLRTGRDDAAHILFTSGSTGEPKGVVITHANVLAFLAWAIPHFGIGPDDRLSGHPPLHFDLSTFDIYGALSAGAQLHLVPPSLNLPPRGIARFIEGQELTQWFSVPSVLTYMAKFDAVPEGGFPTLRRVLSCGDVLPTPVLEHWVARLPHVRFTNLYGPTEATIASSFHEIEAVSPGETRAIPIGTACVGEELLVLDEALDSVETGTAGDLYIGGAGLSPGYWRDEERTRTAFLPDPRPEHAGGRLYRSGDRARIDEAGIVHFLGRADSQVKSRGYRIELGEVEGAVNGLPDVREAAVVGLEGEFEGTALCCAFAPTDSEVVSPQRLKQELRATLPAYMLPSRWLALPVLPKNANGKIDRTEIKRLFAAESPRQ